MSGKNKFGFDPLETPATRPERLRSVGPMGAAVREAAESLQEATDAKVAQRRKNAEDAKAYRSATAEGLMLERLALDLVRTDELPRDRMDLDEVAQSDEMEELKTSIRSRGQKEPIEVYRDRDGNLQLKKGWRRLTALRQLYAETSSEDFALVLARIEVNEQNHLNRYVDMVEENVVRENLSFAEMAQVIVQAQADPNLESLDSDDLIQQLYGSLHKMKRSYIRSFFALLELLGGELKWAKAIPRNLGVDVIRQIKGGASADDLKSRLKSAQDAEEQNAILAEFVRGNKTAKPSQPSQKPTSGAAKDKFEFRSKGMKVTARKGECRIVADVDFLSLPREKLEQAIIAFEAALSEK